jgi:hypothetical protein
MDTSQRQQYFNYETNTFSIDHRFHDKFNPLGKAFNEPS